MCVIVITFVIFLNVVCGDYYAQDFTELTDRKRLQAIAYELIGEAKLKIRQLDGLKDQENLSTAFAVGTIFGRIREKYRSMLELYRMTKNKYTGAASFKLPNANPRRPLHYIIRLEEIRGLEMEIDQMVHILQSMDDNKRSIF